MWPRVLICLLAILCGGNLASAQLPIANTPDASGRLQEWVVSYDAKEDWTKTPPMPFKKRQVGAIRLQIKFDGSKYTGKLWLFTAAPTTTSGTSYSFYGKTDWFELTVSGDSTGRNRIGFEAKAVTLNMLGSNKKIHVHGIWQHGRDKTDRHAERIQLKINHNVITAPAPAGADESKRSATYAHIPDLAGGCDDDPDTDVLEESGSPPDSTPDAPPPDTGTP